MVSLENLNHVAQELDILPSGISHPRSVYEVVLPIVVSAIWIINVALRTCHERLMEFSCCFRCHRFGTVRGHKQ